jgi:hypothetical protein
VERGKKNKLDFHNLHLEIVDIYILGRLIELSFLFDKKEIFKTSDEM